MNKLLVVFVVFSIVIQSIDSKHGKEKKPKSSEGSSEEEQGSDVVGNLEKIYPDLKKVEKLFPLLKGAMAGANKKTIDDILPDLLKAVMHEL